MYQFQCARMTFGEVDAGDATIEHLTEEFLQVSTSFVPHPCFRNQHRLMSCFYDAVGEVDILAETHL